MRKTSRDDLLCFNYDKLDNELKEKSPLLRNVLLAASRRKTKAVREEEEQGNRDHLFWLPSVCVTAAILLKNRSPYMTLFQLLLSLIIHQFSYSVSACIAIMVRYFCKEAIAVNKTYITYFDTKFSQKFNVISVMFPPFFLCLHIFLLPLTLHSIACLLP